MKSLLAFWMGGAGESTAEAGYGSMLAFWMGGYGARQVTGGSIWPRMWHLWRRRR